MGAPVRPFGKASRLSGVPQASRGCLGLHRHRPQVQPPPRRRRVPVAPQHPAATARQRSETPGPGVACRRSPAALARSSRGNNYSREPLASSPLRPGSFSWSMPKAGRRRLRGAETTSWRPCWEGKTGGNGSAERATRVFSGGERVCSCWDSCEVRLLAVPASSPGLKRITEVYYLQRGSCICSRSDDDVGLLMLLLPQSLIQLDYCSAASHTEAGATYSTYLIL